MDKHTKAKIFYVVSMVFGLWFFLYGTTWGWGLALFIAYPSGFMGILFWYFGKKNNPHSKLKNIALGVLIIALIVSVTTFVLSINNVWVPTIMQMPD